MRLSDDVEKMKERETLEIDQTEAARFGPYVGEIPKIKLLLYPRLLRIIAKAQNNKVISQEISASKTLWAFLMSGEHMPLSAAVLNLLKFCGPKISQPKNSDPFALTIIRLQTIGKLLISINEKPRSAN